MPYIGLHIATYIIRLTPQRDFSVTDYIKYGIYLYYLLSLYTGKKLKIHGMEIVWTFKIEWIFDYP